MKVLRIILGVLLIMCSFSMLATPILTSLAIYWIVSIAMIVVGIVAIVNYIEAKNAEKVAAKNGQPYLKTGVGSLVLGIVALVLCILSKRSPESELRFLRFVTILFGLWITLDGISFVVLGTQLKKAAQSGWVVMMIVGVLVAILGVTCIVDGFTSLIAMGTMFGISMMFTGFSFLFGEQQE